MSVEYHDWEKVISKGDPDYTGLEISKCKICSEYKAVPYNCEHEYEMVSTTATCTKAGVETRVCKNCKDIVKVDVPAKGHTVTEDAVITVPATCTTDGKAVGTCDECGKSAIEVVIPAAHKYEEAADNKEATCTEGGLLSKICSVCGDKIYERTEAKGHTEPETGVKTYVATPVYDEDGKVTEYKKTSEEIDITKTTLVNRTLCVNGIVKEYECDDENCPFKAEGKKVVETVYEVKGHNYKTTVKPTCTTDGKKVCTVCTDATADHVVTIPATGHTLTGYAIASTSEEGKYYVNCSDCGILTAELDKDAKTITLVDGTGEEWKVTITYKEDGTTIQSIKIGEKVEAGVETPDPDQPNPPATHTHATDLTGKSITGSKGAYKIAACGVEGCTGIDVTWDGTATTVEIEGVTYSVDTNNGNQLSKKTSTPPTTTHTHATDLSGKTLEVVTAGTTYKISNCGVADCTGIENISWNGSDATVEIEGTTYDVDASGNLTAQSN